MLGWIIAGVLVAGIAIGILLALRSVQWADELSQKEEADELDPCMAGPPGLEPGVPAGAADRGVCLEGDAMTDRDALIKELREAEQQQPDMNTVHNLLRRARQVLSAPGDAEREELAKWCEDTAKLVGETSTTYSGWLPPIAKEKMDKFNRIAQLLRLLAVPKITALFETVDVRSYGATGTLSVEVKRVEQQDDGSYTVVLDYWPEVRVAPVHEDYISHHKDWRSACEIAMQHADCASDRAYWQHQIDTLDKIAALNVSQPGVK